MTNLSINSINGAARSVTGAVIRAVPEVTVNYKRANKTIAWIGKKISSPQNRLILGVSALLSQPFIDLTEKLMRIQEKFLLPELLQKLLPELLQVSQLELVVLRRLMRFQNCRHS